ncbi:MAG: hypothetical protein NVSMB9_02290 [Isosphaeraceae bacterium]
MKIPRSLIASMVLTVVGFLSATGTVAAEKISVDQLPKPVQDAFKAKYPNAKINAAIKVEAEGKTAYEIESTSGGLGIDAVLNAEGKFLECEEEIKVDSLPAAVLKAVKDKHPGEKIEKAEEVTMGEKVFYEVVVKTADGKVVEVAVEKDGTIKNK